ncbi:hypothetical protein Tco_0161966 [Tanacetum coccineum]
MRLCIDFRSEDEELSHGGRDFKKFFREEVDSDTNHLIGEWSKATERQETKAQFVGGFLGAIAVEEDDEKI